MKTHAKLSASGSSRWIYCPGSVKVCDPYRDNQTSSVYADEGTLAHEIADLCLKNKHEASFYVGKTLKELNIEIESIKPTHKIDKDMARNVQEYLDYVLSFETDDSILFTEERVDFSHIVPDGFGTCDSAILVPKERTLHIFDLKYGKGVAVDAFENTQGILYGIGFHNEIGFLDDFDNLTIHICQPRINNFSYFEMTKSHLKKWSDFISQRAILALSESALRIPGEKQCQWCPAKHDCKALMRFTEKVITMEFDDLDVDDQIMSDEDKKTILDNKDLVLDFIKSVEKSVFTRLLSGEKFEGYKIVEGRSNRVFNEFFEIQDKIKSEDNKSFLIEIDNNRFIMNKNKCTIDEKSGKITIPIEDVLVLTLGEKAYTKKLIGISEAEKNLGKDKISKLTFKKPGKYAMVKSSDKRKEVVIIEHQDIIDEFEDMDEGE